MSQGRNTQDLLQELMNTRATDLDEWERTSIGQAKLASLINAHYGSKITSKTTIGGFLRDPGKQVDEGERIGNLRWLAVVAVLFKLTEAEADELFASRGGPPVRELQIELNTARDREKLWPHIRPGRSTGSRASDDGELRGRAHPVTPPASSGLADPVADTTINAVTDCPEPVPVEEAQPARRWVAVGAVALAGLLCLLGYQLWPRDRSGSLDGSGSSASAVGDRVGDSDRSMIGEQPLYEIYLRSGKLARDAAVLSNAAGQRSKAAEYYDESIELISKAIDIAPDDNRGYEERSFVHLLAGDLELGLADAKQAVDRKVTSAWAHNVLGWAYQTVGEIDASFESYSESIRLTESQPDGPTLADPYRGRAVINMLLGDLSAALADYETALQIIPNDQDAMIAGIQENMALLRDDKNPICGGGSRPPQSNCRVIQIPTTSVGPSGSG